MIYSPVAHWVWGGGWIQQLDALDYAGGTVVHITSGSIRISISNNDRSRKK